MPQHNFPPVCLWQVQVASADLHRQAGDGERSCSDAHRPLSSQQLGQAANQLSLRLLLLLLLLPVLLLPVLLLPLLLHCWVEVPAAPTETHVSQRAGMPNTM
jgi:hypothetical protein